ncbi:outer membrane lipoprotein-sorting protein [Acidobacteriota bacterium]
MKKILSLCVLGFFVLSFMSSPSFGEDMADIQKKMIEAQGGRKVLEGIKDTTMTGDIELSQMGLSGTLTMYHIEPNKSRQDIEVMGMVITNAFDGEMAWMINPQTGSSEELPEDAAAEAKRSALSQGNSLMLNPEKYGVKYTFKTKEKVDDRDCLVLTMTHADGHESTLYVDAKTYLLYKSVQMASGQMGGEVEQEMVFADYKEVDGFVYPYTLTIIQDGEEFAIMTITELKINSGLEDSLFKME